LPTHEALRLAEEKGLDLVEISPRAFPPIYQIMDYGKYKYEEAKKKQQAVSAPRRSRPRDQVPPEDGKARHSLQGETCPSLPRGGNKCALPSCFAVANHASATGMNVLNGRRPL
jgi:hypothetical protein